MNAFEHRRPDVGKAHPREDEGDPAAGPVPLTAAVQPPPSQATAGGVRAAALPAVVGGLAGFVALLYQEDG